MAVQKSKKSRSRRGHRRAHQALADNVNLATDKTTGEKHRRHHVSADGYYRGRQVLQTKLEVAEDTEE